MIDDEGDLREQRRARKRDEVQELLSGRVGAAVWRF